MRQAASVRSWSKTFEKWRGWRCHRCVRLITDCKLCHKRRLQCEGYRELGFGAKVGYMRARQSKQVVACLRVRRSVSPARSSTNDSRQRVLERAQPARRAPASGRNERLRALLRLQHL
jgi:hypothetical protein